MYSPAMSHRHLETIVPRYFFSVHNRDALQFNDTTLDELGSIYSDCGYEMVSFPQRLLFNDAHTC